MPAVPIKSTDTTLQSFALVEQPSHPCSTPHLLLGVSSESVPHVRRQEVTPTIQDEPHLTQIKPVCVPQPLVRCFCAVETLHG
jgi:hypothetical protein